MPIEKKSIFTNDRAESARQYDGNGWFEVKKNPISKEGVFPYLGSSIGADDPDKIYNVYRPASELSHPDCIDSFKLLPFLNDHEMVGQDHTPAEEKGIEGVIGENVFFENGKLFANLKVFSGKVSKLIEDGKKELSAGYRCIYDFVSGNWNGQPYDAIQTNIRGNHLALVQEGRMGPDVAVLDHMTITLDAKELVIMNEKEDKKAEYETMTLKQMQDMMMDMKDKMDEMCKKSVEDEEKEKKKTEDESAEEAEKKKDAEDEEQENKQDDKENKKQEKGMDAAEMKKSFFVEAAKKSDLAEKVSHFIGTFDHADKTLDEVASYAIKKLGIHCEKGQEQAVLAGYLHNREIPAKTSGAAMDEKPKGEIDAYLSGTK